MIVRNVNNCSIKAWDFFNTIQKSCFIGYNPIDFSVDTDRLTYIVNETINVSVYPQNISVNLTYGSQSKIVKGNSTFIAESLKNKVQATYGNFEAEKIIFVQDSDKLQKGLLNKQKLFCPIKQVLRQRLSYWIQPLPYL